MKKIFTIIIGMMAVGVTAVAYAESLTLTTYYPAPFGAYDQLRLVPKTPLAGACNPGTMYVRNDNGSIDFCDSGGTWGPPPGMWLRTGTNVYPYSLTYNVGIGTSTPNSPLEIRYDGVTSLGNTSVVRISNQGGGAANFPNIWFISDTGTVGSIFKNSSTGTTYGGAGSFNFGTAGAENVSLLTNNTTRLLIDAAGNVGIGTTVPIVPLHVKGGMQVDDSASTNHIHIWADGTGGYFGHNAGGGITVRTANDFVGVGSTNPATILDVNGQVTVRGGSPGAGKVLTSDATGTATWTYVTYAP